MGTIWSFFILRHRFTSLIIILALVLGLISVNQIPKESNPEVEIPFVVVNTPYPGASAEDVEELVTDVLEAKLIGLDGVKEVTSTSREGVSSIVVEFEADIDSEDQKTKVQDKVDEAEMDLPGEAEDSIINKIEASDDPILTFSLSGPYNVIQLKNFAEELKDEIEKIGRVSEVNIIGGQEREIRVVVDKAALDSYGLSINQVTSAIGLANADIPTGSIETAETDYTVRLAGRLLEVEDINEVPVAAVNNVPILVKDVAKVIDGYEERTGISKLSLNGNPSLPSVTISIKKAMGGNIIELVDKVEQTIKEAEETYLPENVEIEVLLDLAKFIREDIRSLSINGLQTVFIILILLYIFIGGREAVIASLAVPFSFLITFIFLSFFGYTLNFLSLFSLILALGILIDTAVVIIERMNVYIRTDKKKPQEAALLTVKEFQWPLIVGTLTTVFAFVPMLLMSGIMGQYMRFIPITVTIVLLSSLFVGLALIPALAARRLNVYFITSWIGKRNLFGFFDSFRHRFCVNVFDSLTEKYKRALTKLLKNRKRQRRLVVSVIILFFLSLALPITGLLKMNMFPNEDTEYFFIQVKKPIGTQLEETLVITEQIEESLLINENIKSYTISVGQPLFFGGQGDNVAEIMIILKDKEERGIRSDDLADNFQKLFDQTIDAEISVMQMGSGPPSASPIDIGIRGDNLKELETLTLELKEILKDIPGATNVKTTINESKGEFVIELDRAKAQLFGINTVQLAQVLRNAVQGTEATVIRTQGEEIDVIVKYAGLDKADINTLESLTIATPQGDIPLGAFTDVKLKASRPSIRHEDGMRSFRLTGYNEPNVTPLEIIIAFQRKVETLNIPPSVELAFGGEQEDLKQSYNDLFRAMILAIFMIAGILILQFRSYRQPLFILTAIPLSFIGVFPGLILIGSPLTLPAIIGIVALAGIVVNNGIILVDMINGNRLKKMNRLESVINACVVRIRPIILTTITTIVGILPITLSSEVWSSLGFSIIFGLMISAGLTLFVVPYLYFRFAEKRLEGMDEDF